METEVYKGYVIYGHSIDEGEVFASSGTVISNGRVVGSSGVLEFFRSEEDAMAAGLAWAREWVDING
ncbi:hypothetical protein G3N95_31620 [Paraburkholderia sp. Tr-20389]|uniref:hypothetical protein n=1 Tax=Paraburkholderia sp. Tr-20389 TaxID=2703903 RepID=UPI00197DE746|nr:hypothetical protein [Paraburkholderia sp. Tr-20389]MBN3757512.1 hypothetical protein [Paraburkholderia sp. Tr-20389]